MLFTIDVSPLKTDVNLMLMVQFHKLNHTHKHMLPEDLT